ncbi:extracellular solute-binding protein [Paenibacillus sp. LMG 31461]|uniref:Extracellular solute-binding protein n=1 Tax=Paenibacillus plantarum TaxID=2654975 RepID=A0ABX1X983_9BACL|nr:extracellular solute-binding protein [Paenibacillus plantarum]NOU64583.1 extracellular solute-binding protein [Paenibacillus plantarum]
MPRKKGMLTTTLVTAVSLSVALTGCSSQSTDAPAAGKSTSTGKPVTLKMFHFMEAEAGPTLKDINKRFHEKYPNITIEYENAPTDQYQTTIKTRFASGDAPDIIGVFPGTWKDPFVKAGYLMDLSDRPWVSRLQQGALDMESKDGKVYGLPLDQNAIGVIYNKKIFKDLNLTIPKTWNEFLKAADTIKAANITPIALGLKDLWVTQIIPYAMAPSAIYRDSKTFDKDMYDGKATFANSPWKKMMEDYTMMDAKGYFNKGALGTSYDQMVQLMATGKAAMEIMGNWGLPPILAANPQADLGMFPLPYAEEGKQVYVSSAIALGLGANAKTKYPDEVKLYLDFWAEPANNAQLLTQAKAFPVFKDVKPELDATLKELVPYLNVGTYNFLDQNWPAGVQDTMFKGIQNVMVDGGKSFPIDSMLKDMDKVFTEKKGQ